MSRIISPSHRSLGDQYEKALRAMLTSVWRGKFMVLAVVSASLLLGIIAALVMPKTYTAEAYIHGGFDPPPVATDIKTSALLAWDPSILIQTRSRLLASHEVARHVVTQVGLERVQSKLAGRSSWFLPFFYGDTAMSDGFPEDLAATRLQRRVSIKT